MRRKRKKIQYILQKQYYILWGLFRYKHMNTYADVQNQVHIYSDLMSHTLLINNDEGVKIEKL